MRKNSLKGFKCSSVQVFKCSKIQMFKSSNVKCSCVHLSLAGLIHECYPMANGHTDRVACHVLLPEVSASLLTPTAVVIPLLLVLALTPMAIVTFSTLPPSPLAWLARGMVDKLPLGAPSGGPRPSGSGSHTKSNQLISESLSNQRYILGSYSSSDGSSCDCTSITSMTSCSSAGTPLPPFNSSFMPLPSSTA